MDRQNRLLRLLRDNLNAPRAFQVKAEAEEATIYLYDAIGGWFGLPAVDLVKELNALTAPTIHLRINSPGGDVFEARAIATAIQQHSSKIIAHVDGVCASCATVVAIAAREVEMSDGAFFMVHQSWTIAMGNSEDMLAIAALLEKSDTAIAADYERKTKKPKQQIVEWMKAETWFTAQEAKDAGFVDRIAEAATVEARWDLAAYANAPKALTEKKPEPQPQYDREALNRRLALYDRVPA